MKTTLLYAKVFLTNLFLLAFRRKDPKHGWLIVIDGGEGAGKDTMIARLQRKYPHVLVTREPGGSDFAEDIRKVMLESPHAKGASGRTQLLLVSAGRSDHNEKKVEPAILAGQDTIENRGICTSFGYQVGGQQGGYKVTKTFFFLFNIVFDKVRPHRYVIFEVDPEEGARRVANRKGVPNHFDDRKRDFHERVAKAYRLFGRLFPGQVKFVDANKSPDEVFAQLDAIVGPLLSKRA